MEHNLKKHPRVAVWEVIRSVTALLKEREVSESMASGCPSCPGGAVSEASPDAGRGAGAVFIQTGFCWRLEKLAHLCCSC